MVFMSHPSSAVLSDLPMSKIGQIAFLSQTVLHITHAGLRDGPSLRRSFRDARYDPRWVAAIGSEYNALICHKASEKISASSSDRAAPYKWSFSTKEVGREGNEFLFIRDIL